MFTGGSQDMSLTQIYCAERWRDLTLAPQWRLSICLMSLGFLAVAVKWLIDSIRNCPDKAEGPTRRYAPAHWSMRIHSNFAVSSFPALSVLSTSNSTSGFTSHSSFKTAPELNHHPATCLLVELEPISGSLTIGPT
ncbi:hypothetical protein MJO28_007593 [Puccinia striiformis f. sp. tritici]|uniref:Uncharacterized protein n=1 Tax=Puccinia striiformis f. sp. tritici TaxID=168172 RepID=A0ACC0EEW7_9BASI|nr:hypothetical protein MJO28_007593 [Puccinia striiformis f. sp. tritici]KAI7956135.1 hypothetical protein MJO29_007534 [Puccinia striiformis f. sp. tritici]